MAATSDSKTRWVKEVTDFIHSCNFSLNDFLITFYSSEDPSISGQRGCCLVKKPGSRFAPEELIDLWFEHCPPNSRSYLESTIIDRAGKIIIKETDKACKLHSLCIPTTQFGADDLDRQFILSGLEGVYIETLPHLWLLLTAIITSWNSSEKRKNEAAADKEKRAIFVRLSPQICLFSWLTLVFGRPVSSPSASCCLQRTGRQMPSKYSWDFSLESLGPQNVF